jgi:probable F420-dependent oxidoreductase
MSTRHGITVPFDGLGLSAHRELLERCAGWGYSDVWTAEVDGADGFTPLALAAAWEPTFKLGIAIAPVFTRGRALLAQSAAALADAAPGRFFLGVGASSRIIVHDWNGLAYEEPLRRVRETLRFLRPVLAGERVESFRLSRTPEVPPPLYVAALRPQMLRLAGAEADGVILNWLSADDVPMALAEVGAPQERKEVVCRIFCVPTADEEVARSLARRMIAAYLNVEAYAEFHRWLGRGDELEEMWAHWSAGDRRGALDAIPDAVVDALIVHGSPAQCRDAVSRFVDAGVTVPILALIQPPGVRLEAALEGLAPGAGDGGWEELGAEQ